MTQQEKMIKNYVNGIKKHLHLPLKMKARISSDLATDIHDRMEKGEAIEGIMAEMGTPQEVATGFNSELADYHPAGNPWRFLFLGVAILTGLSLAFSIISFLIQPELVFGIIGSADGPSSIYAGTLSVSPFDYLWMTVPFLLGCLATYFLLKWGKWATKKQYTTVIILSIFALVFFTGDLIWVGVTSYLEIRDINIHTYKGNMTTAILLQGLYSILYPSFWLPIITLILSIRRRKKVELLH